MPHLRDCEARNMELLVKLGAIRAVEDKCPIVVCDTNVQLAITCGRTVKLSTAGRESGSYRNDRYKTIRGSHIKQRDLTSLRLSRSPSTSYVMGEAWTVELWRTGNPAVFDPSAPYAIQG